MSMFPLTATSPTSSDPEPVCNSGWYHGYQNIGLQYTVSDYSPNKNNLVIGGGMSSGCKIISGDTWSDSCAVIEYFINFSDQAPSFSYIVPRAGVPPSQSYQWGIVGVQAISINPEGTKIFAALKIGSGPSYTNNPSDIPNGNGCGFYTLTISGTGALSSVFYHKQFDSNCQYPSGNYFVSQQTFSFAFTQNSASEYHIQVFDPNSNTLLSNTKFQAISSGGLSEQIVWTAVGTNRMNTTNQNAVFLGLYQKSPGFKSLAYLVTSGSQVLNVANIYYMQEDFADNRWTSRFSGEFVPKRAICLNNSTQNVYIGLLEMNPIGNLIGLLIFDDSNYDPKVSSYQYTASGNLEIIDGSAYSLLSNSYIQVLVFDSTSKQYFHVKFDWGQQKFYYQLYTFSNTQTIYPLFTMSQNTVFANKNLFFNSNEQNYGLSSTTDYSKNDGFLWRQTNQSSCFQIIKAQESNNRPKDRDLNGNKNSILSFDIVSNTVFTSENKPLTNISLKQFIVINPCKLRLSPPITTTNQIFDTNQITITYNPTVSDTCPDQTIDTSKYKFDSSLINVTNAATNTITNAILSTSLTPTSSYFNTKYNIAKVTDQSLIATYKAYIQFYFYLDPWIKTSDSSFQTVNILCTQFWKSAYPQINQNLIIGSPLVINVPSFLIDGKISATTISISGSIIGFDINLICPSITQPEVFSSLSTISCNTIDNSLFDTSQTIIITATDSCTLQSRVQTILLYIGGNRCLESFDKYQFILPEYQNLTIVQTTTNFTTDKWQDFNTTYPECQPIQYAVSIVNIEGIVDFTWFDVNITQQQITLMWLDYLNYNSTVQIIIQASTSFAIATSHYYLNIVSLCELCTISAPFLQDQVSQQVQIGETFEYIFGEFSKSILVPDCGPLNYTVQITDSAGLVDIKWLTIDSNLSMLKITSIAMLTKSSIVNIKLSGQIRSQIVEANLVWTINPKLQKPKEPTVDKIPTPKKVQINQSVSQVWTINITNSSKPETKIVPLTAEIKKITNLGLVTIKFNKKIMTPAVYKNITQECKNPDYNQTISELLDIWIESGIDLHQLDRVQIINYNLTYWEFDTIEIQLTFKHRDLISISGYSYADKLHIEFKESSVFIDAQYQQQIANDTILLKYIPKQLSFQEAAMITSFQKSISKGMDIFASSNIVLNIFFAFGLKFLWNFVNLLQFLVFIQLWKIEIPENASSVIMFLKSIALMEFIDIKPITNKFSDWVGLDASDDQNIIQQMGIMLVIGVVVIIVAVVIGIAYYFIQSASYKWYRRFKLVNNLIFYNVFIRYIIQSSFKIGIAAGSSIYYSVTYYDQKACVGYFILTVLLISTILFRVTLYRNFQELSLPSMKNKIGSMYLGIKESNFWALSYSQVFMIRRFHFIVLTWCFNQWPNLQIHFFTTATIVYVVYLMQIQPYSDNFQTKVEFFNEIILILILYHYILCTGLVDNQQTIENIGWSIDIHIALLFTFNFLIIITVNLDKLRSSCRIWSLKRKQIKMIKQRANQQKDEQLKQNLEDQKMKKFNQLLNQKRPEVNQFENQAQLLKPDLQIEDFSEQRISVIKQIPNKFEIEAAKLLGYNGEFSNGDYVLVAAKKYNALNRVNQCLSQRVGDLRTQTQN